MLFRCSLCSVCCESLSSVSPSSLLLIRSSFEASVKHGCPSGPRGYVKAVMCSHSRVRVPLRAFFFSTNTPAVRKQEISLHARVHVLFRQRRGHPVARSVVPGIPTNLVVHVVGLLHHKPRVEGVIRGREGLRRCVARGIGRHLSPSKAQHGRLIKGAAVGHFRQLDRVYMSLP